MHFVCTFEPLWRKIIITITSPQILKHIFLAYVFLYPTDSALPPQYSLALEEVLQAQQALLPLRPVGTGTVVQDLSHILRLAQVMWDSSISWPVRALRACARCVAVGIVVRVHPRGFVPPSQCLPLRREDGHWGFDTEILTGCEVTILIKACLLHLVAMRFSQQFKKIKSPNLYVDDMKFF